MTRKAQKRIITIEYTSGSNIQEYALGSMVYAMMMALIYQFPVMHHANKINIHIDDKRIVETTRREEI